MWSVLASFWCLPSLYLSNERNAGLHEHITPPLSLQKTDYLDCRPWITRFFFKHKYSWFSTTNPLLQRGHVLLRFRQGHNHIPFLWYDYSHIISCFSKFFCHQLLIHLLKRPTSLPWRYKTMAQTQAGKSHNHSRGLSELENTGTNENEHWELKFPCLQLGFIYCVSCCSQTTDHRAALRTSNNKGPAK